LSLGAAERIGLVGLSIERQQAFREEVVRIRLELMERTALVLGRSPPRVHLLLENASFVRLEIVFSIFDFLHMRVMCLNASVVTLGSL